MHFFVDGRDDRDLELGWRFMKSAWGKGYATEAAGAVMNVLESNGIRQFTAIAEESHEASINVMKKLGMAYVKTGIHRDPIGDAEVVYYTRKLSQ